jgi:DNA-binding NarL/FixJ family response regulator
LVDPVLALTAGLWSTDGLRTRRWQKSRERWSNLGGGSVSSEPIQVLVVDADPGGGDALSAHLEELEGVEVMGVARNRRAAIRQADTSQPDVMLVDLMLPGFRSIDVIGQVAGTQPRVRILALSPGDPPHDRIILAAQAGALGFVTRDAAGSELAAAIRQVQRGEPWLPLHDTYEVLQDVAPELGVSAQERRSRLGQVVLGLIPLSGLVAAMTAFLWRDYWGQIGVRVVDLGVDPATRGTNVLIVILLLLGVLGPLLFVDNWLQAMGGWVATKPGLASALTKGRDFCLGRLRVGRVLFNRWMAWLVMALLVLFVMTLIAQYAELIVILFVGPAVGVVLLANALGLDDQLPPLLHVGHLGTRRVLVTVGAFLVVFLVALSAEVQVEGPDLRTDGMHGWLAPKALGLSARPVMIFDLDEKNEPLGALYLGGNADLYVLYDPCAETVRFVPVGSSRVMFIDEVTCPEP